MTQVDLAVVGGRIRTLDPDHPHATAVAISGQTITAVGDDAQIRALCGPATELVELDGAAVMPGLTDSHMHPFSGAVDAVGVDLLDAHRLDQVLDALTAERRRCGPGAWVRGWGLDYNVFAQTGISAAVIDNAVGGPAAISFNDWHTMLASSEALVLAGIDGPREFDEGAEVVCVGGRPTGELRENAAMNLIEALMPPVAPERELELCAQHLRRLAAAGLTAVHAMDGTLASLQIARELEAREQFVTRMVIPFTITPETPEEVWEQYAQAGTEHGHRWRAGVAKFFIDGVIDSGTAWLVEPDSQGACTEPFWPDVDRYHRAVKFFAARGFQCVTHAIGDRGVQEALNAYKQAGASPGIHHRVEHIETIQPQDLPRFAAEGVIASMQPQHIMWSKADRSDSWSRRLGHDRTSRGLPFRKLLESGAMVTFGSDWPVARFDPREGIAAAQLRRAAADRDSRGYDEEVITALQALEGYTLAPAYTSGDAHRLGRIKPGYLADITVLAEDPVETDPNELVNVATVATIVDGELVFRS